MADNTDTEYPAESARHGVIARPDNKAIDDEVTAAISQKTVRSLGGSGATNDDIAGDSIITGKIRLNGKSLTESEANDPAPDDEALQPGYVLSERFEIVDLVHSGGMGHVYKAIDKRRHHGGSEQIHVAIKMMRRSVAPQLDARLALEREAARTQRLSHPNIINIYDFDEYEEHFFLVMEWLEGESANALLRRTSGRPLATQFAWQIIHGIAKGLHHAHTHNVVHADINPSNIFITDTQEIKLLDFGVARKNGEPEFDSEEGIVWATHSYASPEVLSGMPPTFEDDIFSLGCIAYRALTGRHPFASLSSTEAMEAKMAPERVPGLAENQWRILRKALSYERANRPSSVTAFFVDLPTSTDFKTAELAPPRSSFRWAPVLIGIAAIAVTAGAWWLSQQNGLFETQAVDSAIITQEADAVLNPVEPSATEVLLGNATQAMNELRLIEPENDNARAYYREALNIDPTNSPAASGLRRISDVYIQQANTALRADNPAGAMIALAVAVETDPENPAAAIISQLLAAQANSELASARLAVAEGDGNTAREYLTRAERFGVINAAEIDELRSRIAQDEWEQAFLGQLADADGAIEAGRLLSPPSDNAFELLNELQVTHGNEPRLIAATERLSQGLMLAAENEIAVYRFAEAAELLGTAITLGVLVPDVMAVQDELQLAIVAAEEAEAAALARFEEANPIVAPSPTANQINELAQPDAGMTSESATVAASNTVESDSVSATVDGFNTAAPTGMTEPQFVNFSDLRVERRVAPRFPARATERELSGSVDLRFSVNTDGSTSEIEIVGSEPGTLFVSSARNAVRQWRFERPDHVIRTEVTLRFDWAPE